MAGDEAEKNRAAAEAEAAEEGGAGGEQQTHEEPLLGDDEHDAGDVETRISNAVEAALTEQRDSVLRAQAEVQNMRRRCEMDVEKAHKFALERFGAELLPVVDNLERALQAAEGADQQAAQALYEGVELTLKGFLETLAKFNIEQIDPQGEPFDPQLHEAITTQPNDDVEPNTVLTVVQKGYTLNGRVIRPAMVVVSKAGA